MVLLPRERVRSLVLRYVEVPSARLLHALRFSPNLVSVLGFSVSVVAAALVGWGFLLAGGIVFLVGGLFDLMDGALARLQNKTTRFGALLDSTLDRLGEGALFVGLGIYAVRTEYTQGGLLLFIVALLLAAIASQSVSYLRARGESLGIDTRAGLMTRPERVLVLSLGLILGRGWIEGALLAVAALSIFTLLYRLVHIWRGLRSG